MIKANLALGKKSEANQYILQGVDVFTKLLNQETSLTGKRQLIAKYLSFYHWEVDYFIEQKAFATALQKAEACKNLYLTQFFRNQGKNDLQPTFEQVKEHLTVDTAVIYWHLSNNFLTTFILKKDLAQPLVIRDVVKPMMVIKSENNDNDNEESLAERLPISRCQQFQRWLANWDQQYQDYCQSSKDKQGISAEKQKEQRKNHLWRKEIAHNLEKLKTILGIVEITSYLSYSSAK